ncbi:hypothetical protein [Oleiagrimonas soli]|nr:hypothetical protein [Oleiagrimonas soli]MBB6184066.1 peptidoglycan/LPS O-acetylase OafA/YrhL [Oleiagrimonas soli]
MHWHASGVHWSSGDFVVAGGLLFGTGCAYVLLARHRGRTAYRAASAIALLTLLMLVWANLAVGILGTEADPANLMYAGVVGVAVIGALLARFRARGMAWALVAAALLLTVIAVVALTAGLAVPRDNPLPTLMAHGIFIALLLTAAWLYRRAARDASDTRPD